METILAYVLDQFYAVYQTVQFFDISYGLNNSSAVQINRTATSFFENPGPWPEVQPIYYQWKNTAVPFWFDEPTGQEVVQFTQGKAIIQADVIAGAFYFLSGWQEYYATDRDRYGRFPYTASLQYKHQLITLPIVNYYFDILKAAIEGVYSVKLQPVFARDSLFTSCLTHDIDNCWTAWRVAGVKHLLNGNLAVFLKLLQQKLTGRDHWSNIPEVMKILREYGVRSSFFFLPNNQKYQGVANADYDIEQPIYQDWLQLLLKTDFEIGVHGSLVTALETGELAKEAAKLNLPVWGNRFHYLKFDPKYTPPLLDAAQMHYDTTLGFSEHFGFRHGTCFPFRLFNFKTRQPYQFLEIPLHLMDATLHHPNYLQLKAEEILPAVSPMLREIEKFGGCFTWLWHNENFSQYNTQNGLAAFHQIMQHVLSRRAAFKTTGQVYDLVSGARGL